MVICKDEADAQDLTGGNGVSRGKWLRVVGEKSKLRNNEGSSQVSEEEEGRSG